MSRIGNKILTVPQGTTVTVSGTSVEVKGPKGTLNREFSPLIAIKSENNTVATIRANEDKHTKQLHGTTNSLIQGMITGVSEGFKKEIEIKGVGYRAALAGTSLTISAGYSHPVVLEVIVGTTLELPKPTEIIITGPDKQKVGQMAALIRDVRRPSVYSGKGIMYKGEHIRRKEGKGAGK